MLYIRIFYESTRSVENDFGVHSPRRDAVTHRKRLHTRALPTVYILYYTYVYTAPWQRTNVVNFVF